VPGRKRYARSCSGKPVFWAFQEVTELWLQSILFGQTGDHIPICSIRIGGNQDAHLRRDLDQETASHNEPVTVATSLAEADFKWTRTVPRLPTSSITHSMSEFGGGVNSPTNVGLNFWRTGNLP
jgi:hypothetical protein